MNYDNWKLATPPEVKQPNGTCQYCGEVIGIWVKSHEIDCKFTTKKK